MVSPYSAAGTLLLGNQQTLADQVAGETADQRRKRLMALQANKMLPTGSPNPSEGYGAALSPAGSMLLGT